MTESSRRDGSNSGSTPREAPVTECLRAWRRGDEAAADALLPIVYAELRRLATAQSRRYDGAATLQPTELVHEAYLKLIGSRAEFEDRVHFFAFAARVMRSVLVDHLKGRARKKRGGDRFRVTWDRAFEVAAEETPEELLRLDEALTRLERFDERKCRILELRYFAGLSYDETGEVLGISKTTVNRESRLARAWLKAEMSAEGSVGS